MSESESTRGTILLKRVAVAKEDSLDGEEWRAIVVAPCMSMCKFSNLRRGDVVGFDKKIVQRVSDKQMGFVRVYWIGEDNYTDMPWDTEVAIRPLP